MKKLLVIFLLSFGVNAYGGMTYFSDGSSAYTEADGGLTYYSDGSTSYTERE